MKVSSEKTFDRDMVDRADDEAVKKFAIRAWAECFEPAYVRGLISESEEMEDGVVTSYTLKFEGFYFTKDQVVSLVKLARKVMAPADFNRMFNILQIEKTDVNED